MFELSPEHEAFRKIVRDFAEREVAPHVARWDREHHLPIHVVRAMGELGLFGLVVPDEYGGGGGGFTSRWVAGRGATSPRCASRSRSSAGSISRSASPSRPAWAWGSTRSSRTALTSRSTAGCPIWWPAARWPRSG